MDLNELTEKMHEFVREQGWYEDDSIRPQTPQNLALAMNLETAEVLELFTWGGRPNRAELESELADVALYLIQLASLSEIDLERAILEKLEINRGRSWPA